MDKYKFNADAAKAGRPVQFSSGQIKQEWIDVHFIGLDRDGTPYVQMPNGSTLKTQALRMKRVTRTYYVNLIASGNRWTNHDSLEQAEDEARVNAGMINFFAVAVPVEIEE